MMMMMMPYWLLTDGGVMANPQGPESVVLLMK